MTNAKFIISLDFELKWGVHDVLDEKYDKNLIGVYEAIPEMLKLFDKYGIHVSWAIVGILFNESEKDFKKFNPKIKPTYVNDNLNPYKITNKKIFNNKKIYLALELINLIKSFKNQEIASHSYSHYNALAKGQNIKQFEEDTKSIQKIALEKIGQTLSSYVFTKNEINNDYLNILKNNGFKIIRTTHSNKIYSCAKNLTFHKKVVRYLDSYFNITGKHHSNINFQKELMCIEGNRFLRPSNNFFLDYLLTKRIKDEMTFVAKNNSIYHLWWHPHNFGVNLSNNLKNLEDILLHFKKLNTKFGMQSINMVELYNEYNKKI